MLQYDMNGAIDILKEQPSQGQRVLVEMLDGKVRIATYDKYDYQLWPVKEWKPIPSEQRQP
jgi:hypothetical protein